MSTPFVPLGAIQSIYEAPTDFVAVTLILLDANTTAGSNTWKTTADLPNKLATTGSYNTAGIAAGNWPMLTSASGAVLELSLPAATYTTAPTTYSLSFRWVVICQDTKVLAAIDFGTAQTLSAAALVLSSAESSYIPGSYPAMRWRKP